MDVDNLGQIFARGMSTGNRNFANVSTLSRELSRFFSEQLNLLCQQADAKGKGKFHVVYAGGDDLFMVGSWDDLAEFAPMIQREFTRYTGDNKHITISGGLIVADYHVPLYHLANWAGKAEEQAKDNGKNRLTLFYQSLPTLNITNSSMGKNQTAGNDELQLDKETTQFPLDIDWKTLETVRSELLKPLMELGLPRSFIYFGLNFTDLMDRNATHFAKFLYQIARLQMEKQKEQAWQSVKTKLVDRKYYAAWRVVFTWLNLWTREGNEHAK
jgi:CRISPR-associated protein Csm1